jgi:hypothetical protein
MKTFIAISLLLLGGCVDKGKCLKSHIVHREASTILIPQIHMVGKITFTTFVPIFTPEHDETVCDKWELR